MTTLAPGKSGYTAWRLIADELRAEISSGQIAVGGRLPAEHELATRFGVNRHTVRQGVAALTAEGLIEARRGSGTYVIGTPAIVHRVGLRTRLSNSIGSAPRAGRVLESVLKTAPEHVRDALALTGDAAVRVETIRVLRDRPVARGTHWFDAERVPDIAAVLSRTGSVTAALLELGIDDYLRASTSVNARPATAHECTELALSPGDSVLVTTSLDTLTDGTPLQYGLTRFAGSRVTLDIDHHGS